MEIEQRQFKIISLNKEIKLGWVELNEQKNGVSQKPNRVGKTKY
ncbi:MAG: hypothetical protein Q8Q51_13695 [Lutibacter sp.]|nr:hypothetical protein [Lutibacter sp.]